MKGITLVVTSCNRFDLLVQTLNSFFNKNTYKLDKIIIIEDSGRKKSFLKTLEEFKFYNIQIIINEKKLGQLASIDRAYKEVESEYIFHCEDDWEFLESGFIEKSIEILESDDKILSVWLRDINEFKKIRFSDEVFITPQGTQFKKVYNEILSFNPGLRRIKDYKRIGSYTKFLNTQFEMEISNFYLSEGMYSVNLLTPCVRHLGWHRRVADIDKQKSKFGYLFDNYLKKIKAQFYKKFHLKRFKQ